MPIVVETHLIFHVIANLEMQIIFEISWQIGAGKYSNTQIKWNAVYFLNIDTILVNGNESARFSNCAEFMPHWQAMNFNLNGARLRIAA